jgi:hypothetical protein
MMNHSDDADLKPFLTNLECTYVEMYKRQPTTDAVRSLARRNIDFLVDSRMPAAVASREAYARIIALTESQLIALSRAGAGE